MKRILLTLLGLVTPLCFAGSNAPSKAVYAPEQIIELAQTVEHYAAERGALAFIIARQGRPAAELPKGIRFTHTAIAIYSQITLDDGSEEFGYAIHNLYQRADQAGVSDLVTDYPVDFFWGTQSLQAGIIIPSAAIQHKLVALYAEDKAKLLHDSRYSVIASPFTEGRQNCTEYTLDLINAAIYDTTDNVRLKQNATDYFKGQRVEVNRFKLTLGSVFSDGISLKDHPDKVYTATFTTIARYLQQYQLADDAVILSADGSSRSAI